VTAPPTASAGPIISARGLTRSFDDHVAVSELSFDVDPGTILGVVGPSGSGKTTTVRMLTGTLARTSGEVEVMGEDPTRFSRAVRGRIAYMPQQFSLYEDLSAQENVGFVAALYGTVHSRGPGSFVAPSRWWTCSRFDVALLAICRAECSGGSSSPAPWCTARTSCSSMSQPPASTRCSA